MFTRVLIACLLAVVLIRPTAAGTGPSDDDPRGPHRHVSDAANRSEVSDATARLAESAASIYVQLSHADLKPFWSNVASLSKGGSNLSQCSQALALGPDVQCVRGCDASKDSCEGKCSSGRAGCMAQCPGLGFACDYYCQAAFYVCRGNCAKDRQACVGNCPTKGGEKEQ